ncbi:hypothetical protein BROOKERS_41 [Proteus phage vB_PmiP_Brookers]|nr:hypothetical protein BROOKERS_41 [Proteus phage vB_PmiP_Brookers]
MSYAFGYWIVITDIEGGESCLPRHGLQVGDQHLPPITKDHLGGKYGNNNF